MTAPVSYVVVTPVYEDVDASSRLFSELSAVLGDSVFIVADGRRLNSATIEAGGDLRCGIERCCHSLKA